MDFIQQILPAHNVIVYDVAASTSGALSVLLDFYKAVQDYSDKSINWFFLVSIPDLKETDNVKVIRLPWVKKSWMHRLYCDCVIAPKLIKELAIDKVVSLQNIGIPQNFVPQVIYLHQSLPFADYKFKLLKNPLLWVYQNIIGQLIFCSVKKAQKVIVQTKWMKNACIEKTNIIDSKICVVYPKINLKPRQKFTYSMMAIPTFIYPATPLIYKKHIVIIEACKYLVSERIGNFQVIFSINGSENSLARKLREESKRYKLPIKFIGLLKREDLFMWYTKSILIFPSCIESFPLPLVEAMIHETPIISSRTPFAMEVLGNYHSAVFYSRTKELATVMRNVVKFGKLF